MKTLQKILDLLNQHERKQVGLLLGLILINALLDMVGVASIIPFMAVLANPQLVETSITLNKAFQISSAIGILTPGQFLFALGILVFGLLVFSLGFKAFTTYVQMRFTLMREYTIGKRLLDGYLNQPYSWFLSRHSADMGKSILSEVSAVINGALIPALNLIAQGTAAVALLLLLVMIDPELAVTVGLVLGLAYALIFRATKSLLTLIGSERISANQARFETVSDAFGAVKEVKIAGLESTYINRFGKYAQIYAKNQATAQIIGQMPRFALEAIAFGGMILLVLLLMSRSEDFAAAIPIITLYAYGGYRLMPALQQIYGAATQLIFSRPALDALHQDLTSLQPVEHNNNHKAITFRQNIALNHIDFKYPNSQRLALNNVNFTIRAGMTVGLVGSTGSGKTTTIDLLLGLLEPIKGTLEIDGVIINSTNKRSWQQIIGYVPQQIYLSDNSVKANIAFGINAEEIDQEAVERAAKIANLHEFIINELPNQYETTVGERGVRFSGGQRQRIGIARALYHKPKVLILDEATSALDNLTEQVVMEAVHKLGHEVTIIMIAHRLSTVKECDTIFLFEQGELKAQGNFNELKKMNLPFRLMAEGSNKEDLNTKK